jgi:hypothetical protein
MLTPSRLAFRLRRAGMGVLAAVDVLVHWPSASRDGSVEGPLPSGGRIMNRVALGLLVAGGLASMVAGGTAGAARAAGGVW